MKPQLVIQCGVYRIRNLVSGISYYGSSVTMRDRLTEHKRQLRNGVHTNQHLQAAWDRYGPKAFVFDVILCCDREDVLECEQMILDEAFGAKEPIYNISKNAKAPMMGLHHSESVKLKISQASKGKPSPMLGKRHSLETRQAMSKSHRGERHWTFNLPSELHPLYGRKHSEETRKLLSKQKLGPKNPRFGKIGTMHGKKHSAEARLKISAAKRGKPWTEGRRDACGG